MSNSGRRPLLALRRPAPALLLALWLVAAPIAGAWGPRGHRVIALAALASLPDSFPGFVQQPDVLAFLANEPDRWRGADVAALQQANAPDHFINLERVAFLGEDGNGWPRDRYQFLTRLRQQAQQHPGAAAELEPAKVGLQPYATLEAYQKLVRAFQKYRVAGRPTTPAAQAARQAAEINTLAAMGVLAHFIGDGSQPLHVSENYNGWVEANPHGYSRAHTVHRAFETTFVNRIIPADEEASALASVHPQVLADPFGAYIAYLWRSHSQVERLYELERDGAFRGAGTAAGRQFVLARLHDGAEMLASFYLSAWQASARPADNPLLRHRGAVN